MNSEQDREYETLSTPGGEAVDPRELVTKPNTDKDPKELVNNPAVTPESFNQDNEREGMSR
ncbi:MAG: hypothetical protein LRZ84_03290 [Desertifilum sp.]|nr:hypothetical protein [Desertifilum sp.]NES95893.1 hypothetical protein [Desertifilum sp. SIO1I2]